MTDGARRPVSITIDGRPVRTPEGRTVLEAALDAGVYIPHLCWQKGLEPYGGCRLCIVKIDGIGGMPPACTTRVSDGMVVESDVEEVNGVRRMVAEMLIADHPPDCLTCTSNRRCELQEIAAYLGVEGRRLRPSLREREPDESNPFFVRDLNKCVLCGRCARICHELRGVGAVDLAFRGHDARVTPAGGGLIIDSACESCGECVDACPTGALFPKAERMRPVSEVRTVCPYCGVGCALVLGTRRNRIVSVKGDPLHPVSRGSLCVKGRFGLDFVSSPERLAAPLVREGGELRPASWDEALGLVASKLLEIKDEHGPDAIGFFTSAKCTNEENYLLQKLARAAVGTNNVDHCARLCHASTVVGLVKAFGSGAMTNSATELAGADCILVTGSNTTEAHPVLALYMKKAVARGASLILADARRIDLARFAAVHLRQRPGTDVALFSAMANVIVEEGLADDGFISERTEDFEEFASSVKNTTPEWAAEITGVQPEDVRRAARIYAAAKAASIVYSMGITQHTTGTDNVLALANLAMLTGNVGRPSTGVNPLRGQNNVQGACDLGALSNVLPGYQSVADETLRAKFEAEWGGRLPAEPGLTIVEMLHAAESGKLRALFVMGENPAISDPNTNRTLKDLKSLELLVVQDVFLTETAKLADVVLPGAVFAEKEGTFTNTERRVQLLRKALDPPGSTGLASARHARPSVGHRRSRTQAARPDWEIICDLSSRLGLPMSYSGPSEVMDEIARLTPIYGGMSYDRLEGPDGLTWPCPARDHPGTPVLHVGRFSRGRGKFHALAYRPPVEPPDSEYPYCLTTGRLLEQFHTGTLTRRSPGIEALKGTPTAEVNPLDAKAEGIRDGERVELSSRRGTITAVARVTDRVPPGLVFMPFHYREAPANVLTIDALDPVAKIPELKVCAVRMGRAR